MSSNPVKLLSSARAKRLSARSTLEQDVRELRVMVGQSATKQDIADVRDDIRKAKEEILGAIHGRGT